MVSDRDALADGLGAADVMESKAIIRLIDDIKAHPGAIFAIFDGAESTLKAVRLVALATELAGVDEPMALQAMRISGLETSVTVGEINADPHASVNALVALYSLHKVAIQK